MKVMFLMVTSGPARLLELWARNQAWALSGLDIDYVIACREHERHNLLADPALAERLKQIFNGRLRWLFVSHEWPRFDFWKYMPELARDVCDVAVFNSIDMFWSGRLEHLFEHALDRQTACVHAAGSWHSLRDPQTREIVTGRHWEQASVYPQSMIQEWFEEGVSFGHVRYMAKEQPVKWREILAQCAHLVTDRDEFWPILLDDNSMLPDLGVEATLWSHVTNRTPLIHNHAVHYGQGDWYGRRVHAKEPTRESVLEWLATARVFNDETVWPAHLWQVALLAFAYPEFNFSQAEVDHLVFKYGARRVCAPLLRFLNEAVDNARLWAPGENCEAISVFAARVRVAVDKLQEVWSTAQFPHPPLWYEIPSIYPGHPPELTRLA